MVMEIGAKPLIAHPQGVTRRAAERLAFTKTFVFEGNRNDTHQAAFSVVGAFAGFFRDGLGRRTLIAAASRVVLICDA